MTEGTEKRERDFTAMPDRCGKPAFSDDAKREVAAISMLPFRPFSPFGLLYETASATDLPVAVDHEVEGGDCQIAVDSVRCSSGKKTQKTEGTEMDNQNL